MIRNSYFWLLAMAALSHAGDVGPALLMSGSGTLRSGITVQYATYAIPGGTQYGAGGIAVGSETIHRDLGDGANHARFSYDLEFRGDAKSGYQAVFLPPREVAGEARGGIPKYPPPMAVRDGDVIALDLMVSPDGSRRITDYIRVLMRPPEPPAATTVSPPRDFTVDDGPVIYDASFSSIWINGRKYEQLSGFTGRPGATFWAEFPGMGRYLLSLVPHEGFQKAGAVRDNTLAFEDGGQRFEFRFMSPIAGQGKAWNLYVRRDGDATRHEVRYGTGRLEDLLAKK